MTTLAEPTQPTERGQPVRVAGTRGGFLTTWVRRRDYAVLPVGDAIAGRLAPTSALRTSWRRTVAAAGRSKRIVPVPAAPS